VRAIIAFGNGDARMAVSRADAEKSPYSAFRFEPPRGNSRMVGYSDAIAAATLCRRLT
jgi:hypothetical protein